MIKPAIIIIAYNRPISLNRLLNSLDVANYDENDVPLIISIDYQASKENKKVLKIAENYNWKHGIKKIIKHSKNLGLRAHVITCGDLVNIYDNIIVLEDDLFVSPYFYKYANDALKFYNKTESIGGISLYNHKRNFLNTIPFELIPDSNDVFFLQIASSWGQAWSKKQWLGFKNWYNNQPDDATCVLPLEVKNWPESSWLKYYICYLIWTNKYFVYPNKSLTTNFGDNGTHNLDNNAEYQVPVFFGNKYTFIDIKKSINVYDVYFELLPSRLKLLFPKFNNYDFSVDLYGKKNLNKIKSKFILTSKYYLKKPLLSFGLELKPSILNILFEIQGDVFNFGEKDNFKNTTSLKIYDYKFFNYYYSKLPMKSLIKLIIRRIKKIRIKFD